MPLQPSGNSAALALGPEAEHAAVSAGRAQRSARQRSGAGRAQGGGTDPPCPGTDPPCPGTVPPCPAPRRQLTQLELLAFSAGVPHDPAPEYGPGVDHRLVGGPVGPGRARHQPAGQRRQREQLRRGQGGRAGGSLSHSLTHSPSLLAVAVQENRVAEEGPVAAAEEQRVLRVQVVGPRRRQALAQQEQRGGPARSAPRPPAAPHSSGRAAAHRRRLPASPLGERAGQRRAPPWVALPAVRAGGVPANGAVTRAHRLPLPLSLPRRCGSDFSPPRPRPRDAAKRSGPRAVHSPEGRGRPDTGEAERAASPWLHTCPAGPAKGGRRYYKLVLKSPAERRAGSSTQARDRVLRKEVWRRRGFPFRFRKKSQC